MTNVIGVICKYCNSQNVVKFGTDAVARGKVMPSVLERKSHITGIKLPPKHKRKHPKRRPESLADKTYYQATISQVRL